MRGDHAHSPANADIFRISREYIQTTFLQSCIAVLHFANATAASYYSYNLENLSKNYYSSSAISNSNKSAKMKRRILNTLTHAQCIWLGKEFILL